LWNRTPLHCYLCFTIFVRRCIVESNGTTSKNTRTVLFTSKLSKATTIVKSSHVTNSVTNPNPKH
jgi:hypothetical protein